MHLVPAEFLPQQRKEPLVGLAAFIRIQLCTWLQNVILPYGVSCNRTALLLYYQRPNPIVSAQGAERQAQNIHNLLPKLNSAEGCRLVKLPPYSTWVTETYEYRVDIRYQFSSETTTLCERPLSRTFRRMMSRRGLRIPMSQFILGKVTRGDDDERLVRYPDRVCL